ncbi:MAG: lysophospholipid acyltransferase family protein [Bryobacteraceae bacterium]
MWVFLRTVFFTYPGIIASTFVFGTMSIIVSPFASTGRSQHALARRWASWLLWFAGIRVRVEGAENIPPGGPFVFVANHRSYFDSPIVLPYLRVQFRFFAKASVFYWPLIGYHLKKSGHLPVHYDNPRESLKSMTQAARVIQRTGISVLLFPEAGRTTGELEAFKDGAAYVAIKAGVPMIPLGIVGSLDVQPPGSFSIHPGEVVIRVGTPVPTIDIPLGERTRLSQLLWVRVADLIGYPAPAEKREAAERELTPQ